MSKPQISVDVFGRNKGAEEMRRILGDLLTAGTIHGARFEHGRPSERGLPAWSPPLILATGSGTNKRSVAARDRRVTSSLPYPLLHLRINCFPAKQGIQATYFVLIRLIRRERKRDVVA